MPIAQLFVQPCCRRVAPLETLERIQPRHLEMERMQMMTGCKLTLSRKVRGRTQVKNNTREEIAPPARPTRALQISTRARTVANLDIGRKIAGIPVEERRTIPLREIVAKASVNTQEKGKANTWTLSKQNNLSLLKQPQPCPYPSQDPSVIGELSYMSSVDSWIMGVTINSVSSIRRQAGAEYLLPDSGAQPHACPLTYPGQKIPLLDPGNPHSKVEHDSNMTEDAW